jgi:proteasome lid subunit RPN8/RPN11
VARVEIDRSLPPVVLPARIVSELLAHARETHPEECCGLIVGTGRQRYGRLVRCRNEMTKLHQIDPLAYPLDGRAAFWMNEVDYLQTRAEAEAAHQRVTAVYHSHVGSGAYLSELDLGYAHHALFPFPEADQIVVAVASPDPESLALRLDEGCVDGVGIFVWDAAQRGFQGRRIRPSAP